MVLGRYLVPVLVLPVSWQLGRWMINQATGVLEPPATESITPNVDATDATPLFGAILNGNKARNDSGQTPPHLRTRYIQPPRIAMVVQFSATNITDFLETRLCVLADYQ